MTPYPSCGTNLAVPQALWASGGCGQLCNLSIGVLEAPGSMLTTEETFCSKQMVASSEKVVTANAMHAVYTSRKYIIVKRILSIVI